MIIRVATKDQYCYVEEDYTGDNPKARYEELKAQFQASDSPVNAFYSYLIALMDSNLAKWGTADEYAQLNEKQKEVVQAIKRYSKRIKSND